MPPPLPPLTLSSPVFGEEEQRAVAQVLQSGQVASGPRVREFEEKYAKTHGARFGIATGNATVGLELALRAMGVGAGDEVILPAFTFVATANVVLANGAVPRFADIDPTSFNIDPESIRRLVTPRTKAILPVHLFGNPADLDAINEAAPGISILEDAAQAHLAQTNGRPVGALGAAGCFSFYPTKNMTTIEGGMITTNDPTLADRSRSFANHGREPDAKLGTYDHVRWGTNARMTDVSAAIGLVQLAKLPAWTEARRRNARRLSEGLGDAVATPSEAAGSTHVFHQYTIRIPAGTRDRVLARLKEQGVGAGVYYPRVLYHYPHLAPFSAKCPEAERAALEVLSVPVHPRLSDADVDRVVASIRAALSAEGATKPGPAAGPRRPLA